VLLSLFGVVATPAYAYLGGDVGSVSADALALHGQGNSSSMLHYDLHVITAATGTIVHEYTTRDNRVFAVTWQGPTPPDLRVLFGDFFDRYQSAATTGAAAGPGAHRQFSMAAADLVVRSAGRPRAFRGRAYLRSLVPDGVAVEDLP